MKSITKLAIILIALAVIAIVSVTLGFHSYTEDAYRLMENPDGTVMFRPDGTQWVDDAGETIVRPPQWRPGEVPMHLDTMRTIAGIAGGVGLIGVILFLVGQAKDIKKQDVIGVLLILLGLATIFVYLTVLYPCAATMPAMPRMMRCFFTMRVLFAVAGAISLMGILMLLFRRSKEIAMGLSMAAVLASVAVIVIPTMATGVCASPDMPCYAPFVPFAVVIGGVMTAVSLVGALVLAKREEEEDEEL